MLGSRSRVAEDTVKYQQTGRENNDEDERISIRRRVEGECDRAETRRQRAQGHRAQRDRRMFASSEEVTWHRQGNIKGGCMLIVAPRFTVWERGSIYKTKGPVA